MTIGDFMDLNSLQLKKLNIQQPDKSLLALKGINASSVKSYPAGILTFKSSDAFEKCINASISNEYDPQLLLKELLKDLSNQDKKQLSKIVSEIATLSPKDRQTLFVKFALKQGFKQEEINEMLQLTQNNPSGFNKKLKDFMAKNKNVLNAEVISTFMWLVGMLLYIPMYAPTSDRLGQAFTTIGTLAYGLNFIGVYKNYNDGIEKPEDQKKPVSLNPSYVQAILDNIDKNSPKVDPDLIREVNALLIRKQFYNKDITLDDKEQKLFKEYKEKILNSLGEQEKEQLQKLADKLSSLSEKEKETLFAKMAIAQGLKQEDVNELIDLSKNDPNGFAKKVNNLLKKHSYTILSTLGILNSTIWLIAAPTIIDIICASCWLLGSLLFLDSSLKANKTGSEVQKKPDVLNPPYVQEILNKIERNSSKIEPELMRGINELLIKKRFYNKDINYTDKQLKLIEKYQEKLFEKLNLTEQEKEQLQKFSNELSGLNNEDRKTLFTKMAIEQGLKQEEVDELLELSKNNPSEFTKKLNDFATKNHNWLNIPTAAAFFWFLGDLAWAPYAVNVFDKAATAIWLVATSLYMSHVITSIRAKDKEEQIDRIVESLERVANTPQKQNALKELLTRKSINFKDFIKNTLNEL